MICAQMSRPQASIVPLGPNTEYVAMYLDDTRIGIARNHAVAAITLAIIEREMEEVQTTAQRLHPRRRKLRRGMRYPVRVVGVVESEEVVDG